MLDRFRKTETERLLLREITLDDADALFEICSNDNVTRYLTYPSHQDVSLTRKIIQSWVDRNVTDHIPIPYALILKAENRMIGQIDYVYCESDIVEVGYQLNEDYWGRGYMSEALTQLIRESFTYMGVRRIEIRHMVSNHRSQRVIEKAGFIYEGTARKYGYNKETGQFEDCRMYALLKEEWESRENERIGQ